MLIPVPLRRRTYLWNPASGELTRLSELEAALLAESPQPMPAVCPTATRYAVAKYDSDAVNEAYDALRSRFAAAGEVEVPHLTIGKGASESLAEAALRAAGAAFPGRAIALDASPEILALADSLGIVRA